MKHIVPVGKPFVVPAAGSSLHTVSAQQDGVHVLPSKRLNPRLSFGKFFEGNLGHRLNTGRRWTRQSSKAPATSRVVPTQMSGMESARRTHKIG